MNLKLEFVRKQFPALHGDWVFMDNAGGSQTLKQVADKINDYLLYSNVQLGATYDISQTAGERVDEGVQTVTELINAQENEVVLGSSTSLLLRILSLCLVQTFFEGDEVIVTNCDHEANIGPWRSLERYGIVVKEWRLNPETFSLNLEELERLMTDKTRLVALTHASNILGTLNPIKQIASLVHDHGAMICVDGVAFAPHRLVDVKDLDVDFYAFSFYKVYGPHYSLLYGKKEYLERMPGFNHFFLEDMVPYKFQPGSVNYELSCGLSGLKDYFEKIVTVHDESHRISQQGNAAAAFAYELFARHEETLSKRLISFLNSKSNVRIIGSKEWSRTVRVPTVSFVIDGIKSSTIPPKVDNHKIAIRFGDFYARRLIDDLGLAPQDGVIRVSLVHYNTMEELNRLVEILEQII